DRGSAGVRTATDGLRPALLDDLGLVPALRALVGEVRDVSGLPITFDVRAERMTAGRLPPATELALFRALQEALSNVMRHAGATSVAVSLAIGGAVVVLRIEDDGSGIAPERLERLARGGGRSGLFGMQQRIAAVGGSVRFVRGAADGLLVEVAVPT